MRLYVHQMVPFLIVFIEQELEIGSKQPHK